MGHPKRIRRSVPSPWARISVLLALMPLLAHSAGKEEELPARAAYIQGLNQFLKGEGGTLQSVYALGRAAAREELEAVIEWDQALATGRVPKRRFERILPGFHVGANVALYVVPDSRFFLELAKQRGNDVDRRFFGLLHQTFHGAVARVYINPMSEATACFDLGSREFIALYRGWSQFKASNPKAYADSVSEELQILEQSLLTATCACGTREIVDAGFEAFLREFPRSPIAKQARARLEKLHANSSGLSFQCGQELNVGQPLPYGVPTPPIPKEPAEPTPSP